MTRDETDGRRDGNDGDSRRRKTQGATGRVRERQRATTARARESQGGGGGLLAWLRRLGAKLASLASRVAGALKDSPANALKSSLGKALKGSLGDIKKRLKSPRTWLSLLASRLSGFRSWWLATTVAIAGSVGLVVAIVLLPVAAVLALLVVAVGALVRRLRQDSAAGQQAAA
jgi:hypothetical protein